MPMMDPSDLVERILLLYKEDGKRLSTHIVKDLDYFEGDLDRDSSCLRLFYNMNDDVRKYSI